MKRTLILLPALLLAATTTLDAQTLRGWTKGKGFGWVWGKDDQIGALNAILTPERTLQQCDNSFKSMKAGGLGGHGGTPALLYVRGAIRHYGLPGSRGRGG